MDQVLKCVEALKNVRRCMHDDVDPGIVAGLDEAIRQLERSIADGQPSPPNVAQAAIRALAILGDVLTCLGAVAELVRRFRA